ncbi:MAG: anti-phage ZorAB system protein ZorA [Cetobacterium sp.]|uniref:anti-phage ZorAB system protein ZorA n=1 Tax=Cetobacterium sp. TaxID=2071632 RepID=UPI003EE663CB
MNIILSFLIFIVSSFAIYIKSNWLDKSLFSLEPKDLLNNIFFWVMFIIFVLVSFYRILKDIGVLKEIKKMGKELKETNTDNISYNYDIINENFLEKSNYKILSENWRAFKNSLFIKNSSEIYQTIDAEVYFNSVNLMKEKMNFKLLNYFPQLLVGLGMLGTFLGLSIGLADLNLTSDDKGQLTTLILGTKTAFYTSLYGMYFSICMSIILNSHLGRYEREILHLKDKLNCIFKKYIRDQRIEEIKDEIIVLRKTNEELSNNVGTELVKGVNEYNESNKEHLKNLTTLVSTNISGLADEVSEAFEKRLEKIFSKDFIKPFNSLKTSLVEISKENNKSIESYSLNLKEITKEIFEVKNSLGEVSTTATSNFTLVLDRLENKYDEVVKIFSENKDMYEKYQTLLKNSKDIILSSDSYVKKLENIGNIFQNFTSKEETLYNFWENNKNILNEFGEKITENHKMWEERYENQEEKLNEYYEKHLGALFNEYDQELTKAILSFKEMLNIFIDKTIVVNESIETSNRLIEETQSITKEKYKNDTKDILEEFEEISKSLKNTMEISKKYEEKLMEFSEEKLNKLFEKYNLELEKGSEATKVLIENFTNGIISINENINNTNKLSQENQKSNENFYKEENERFLTKFNDLISKVAEIMEGLEKAIINKELLLPKINKIENIVETISENNTKKKAN